MGTINSLMRLWRNEYDGMAIDTSEIRAQLAVIQGALDDIEGPYKERMAELEAEIKQMALAAGEGAKGHKVVVSYRSGYERVSYDSGKADAVLGVLRDVLPETAKTLDGARKSTFVSPSVSVKAVD